MVSVLVPMPMPCHASSRYGPVRCGVVRCGSAAIPPSLPAETSWLGNREGTETETETKHVEERDSSGLVTVRVDPIGCRALHPCVPYSESDSVRYAASSLRSGETVGDVEGDAEGVDCGKRAPFAFSSCTTPSCPFFAALDSGV